MKKLLIFLGVLVTIGFLAMIVQTVAHRMWERDVWSCYSALGDGRTPLKNRFLIPTTCRAAQILVIDLGTPNAEVGLVFRPPRTMWLSYMLKTVEYDSYAIELSTHEGVTRAHMHHGSD